MTPTWRMGSEDAGGGPAAIRGVEELLDSLVDEVLEGTSVEGLVVVCGWEHEIRVRGGGVSPDGADIAAALAHGELPSHPSALTRPGGEADGLAISRIPGSWGSASWLPLPVSDLGFFAGLLVDIDFAHPDVHVARSMLEQAAPRLARAQLRALGDELRDLRARHGTACDALDAMPDPVLVVDAQAAILCANARAEHLLMTGPEEMDGRRDAVEHNHLLFSDYVARESLGAPATTAAEELLMIDPSDGSDIIVQVFKQRMQRGEGGPDNIVYVLHDVSDLTRVTHELELQVSRSLASEHRARRESERLNVVIENAGLPILVTNTETEITLINLEAERLLEFDGGRTGAAVGSEVGRSNAARLSALLEDFLLQPAVRQVRQITLADRQDHGRTFPVSALSTKIPDELGRPIAVITVLHDLTQEVEIRNLADKLQRLNVELEGRVAAATRELAARNARLEEQRAQLVRASRMKSQFLATMSHELRTPINAIIGYNSLIRDGVFGSLTEKQAAGLDRMRRAADHLLLLINDILDLSRIEAGKTSFVAKDVDLRIALDKLADTVRSMAEEKGLDFIVDIDPGVRTIRTDETRLGQVLLNLLSNAVKYTREGSIRLIARPAERGDGLCLEVVDTGIGITEANLEVIFDEFTQVDQSETREQGGTGLGLAISRKLALLMGGTLSVLSRPGAGTTFSLVLPPAPPAEWVGGDHAVGSS